MAAGSQSDELHSLQTENRHLKEMVCALRDEAKQLHEIIRALRGRLEGQDEKR